MMQVYKIFKAAMKTLMKYMSSVDATCEKQVAKQYKAQTSPYQASVTHNTNCAPIADPGGGQWGR